MTSTPAPTSTARARKKVLAVDDSATVLLAVELLLARDHEVLTARDGQEALAVARAARPDLVLLDVVMPGLDGFETCRRLREAEETRVTPIILVTTRGELESLERGYEAGCTDYVTKPFHGTELLAKVRSCLGE